METKQRILQHIKQKKVVTSSVLIKLLGISRQAINKHITELIQAGLIIKEGTTRSARYCIPSSTKKIDKSFSKIYRLHKLDEDMVFGEFDRKLSFKKHLKEKAYDIIHYAFTELCNNAIEHSRSSKCRVDCIVNSLTTTFTIRDYGIGVFYSLFKKFNLPNEEAAVGELIKGKRTTMPERHTGEGIFFTSKCADSLRFRSHKIELLFDNREKDVFVEEKRFLKGTEVCFTLRNQSTTKLSHIFNSYAPEEFGFKFAKTKVWVKLFQTQYVSRSEAKRLFFGLDKFRVIVLDFKGVKSLGQGFADEAFRVFQKAHPHITIQVQNVKPTIKVMIDHVVDNKK